MQTGKSDEKLGRFISLVLRHQPEAIGLTLDEHGWADVNELLSGMQKSGRRMSMEDLERIVETNNKKRYGFNDDHTKIRARQGHSIKVDVELQEKTPPALLYHGTATRFLDSMERQGITRQSRQYVHLSRDRETAVKVGQRHGKPAVLTINATAMQRDGTVFYLSENGVWLCDFVPWSYVTDVWKA